VVAVFVPLTAALAVSVAVSVTIPVPVAVAVSIAMAVFAVPVPVSIAVTVPLTIPIAVLPIAVLFPVPIPVPLPIMVSITMRAVRLVPALIPVLVPVPLAALLRVALLAAAPMTPPLAVLRRWGRRPLPVILRLRLLVPPRLGLALLGAVRRVLPAMRRPVVAVAMLVTAVPLLVLGRRVRPVASAPPVFLAIVAVAAAAARRALAVPTTVSVPVSVAVSVPAAVVAVPAPVLVALAGVAAPVGAVERTAPRATAVEPGPRGAGGRRWLVIIYPASSLEMFVARVGESTQHGFRALGRVQGHVRVRRWEALCAFTTLVWPLVRGARGTFPSSLSFLAVSFLPGITAERTPKLVDIGIRVRFAAASLMVALAVLVWLPVVALVIPVTAAAVSVLVASAPVSVPVTTASSPTAEPVLIPTIVIELVLVAIITLIVSCLEARVKRAIITIAHARSAWMIVIILAGIP
jgi:hypothetical protein